MPLRGTAPYLSVGIKFLPDDLVRGLLPDVVPPRRKVVTGVLSKVMVTTPALEKPDLRAKNEPS